MVVCFLAPYTILLSRGLKKTPAALGIVAGVAAVGIWLERFVVNMASVHTYWMHESPLPLDFITIGMSLGFGGLFVLVILKFLEGVPAAVVSDPYLDPHFDNEDHVEVHPHHHAEEAH